MIGETAFKGLCIRSFNGHFMRALFITPDALTRDGQKLDMINAAAKWRGLTGLWRKSNRTLQIGPSIIYQRIAHRYLDQELQGIEWHFIHGLEYVEALPGGDAIAQHLTAMARL